MPTPRVGNSRAAARAWREGRLATQECLQQQLALITLTPADLQELLPHTRLTPGFTEFDAWRKSQGLPLTLLSDGMEPVIRAVLAHHGISQVTLCANQWQLEARPQQVRFPFAHAAHPAWAKRTEEPEPALSLWPPDCNSR